MASIYFMFKKLPEAVVNKMNYHFTGVGNMVTAQGCAYAFCVILLDKMYSQRHTYLNRTLHASASACAPGGSFFAQIVAKAALK